MTEHTTHTTQAADLVSAKQAEMLEWMINQDVVEEIDAEADARYGWESK